MQSLDLTLRSPFGRARVWTSGEGKPLLLVHGGIGDAQVHWGKLASHIAPKLRVMAPALPGYDGSDPLPSPSWESLTDWLAAILDELHVDRTAVCGNSFGGATARAFTSRFPERVTHLFLVNGGLVPPIPRWVAKISTSALFAPFSALMRAGMYSRGGLRSMIANEDVLTDEFIAHARDQATRFTKLVMAVGASGSPPFRATNVPTTVLWGAADRTLPEAKARELATQCNQAQVVLFEKAGHMPQIEAPEEFARALMQALEGQA